MYLTRLLLAVASVNCSMATSPKPLFFHAIYSEKTWTDKDVQNKLLFCDLIGKGIVARFYYHHIPEEHAIKKQHNQWISQIIACNGSQIRIPLEERLLKRIPFTTIKRCTDILRTASRNQLLRDYAEKRCNLDERDVAKLNHVTRSIFSIGSPTGASFSEQGKGTLLCPQSSEFEFISLESLNLEKIKELDVYVAYLSDSAYFDVVNLCLMCQLPSVVTANDGTCTVAVHGVEFTKTKSEISVNCQPGKSKEHTEEMSSDCLHFFISDNFLQRNICNLGSQNIPKKAFRSEPKYILKVLPSVKIEALQESSFFDDCVFLGSGIAVQFRRSFNFGTRRYMWNPIRSACSTTAGIEIDVRIEETSTEAWPCADLLNHVLSNEEARSRTMSICHIFQPEYNGGNKVHIKGLAVNLTCSENKFTLELSTGISDLSGFDIDSLCTLLSKRPKRNQLWDSFLHSVDYRHSDNALTCDLLAPGLVLRVHLFNGSHLWSPINMACSGKRFILKGASLSLLKQVETCEDFLNVLPHTSAQILQEFCGIANSDDLPSLVVQDNEYLISGPAMAYFNRVGQIFLSCEKRDRNAVQLNFSSLYDLQPEDLIQPYGYFDIANLCLLPNVEPQNLRDGKIEASIAASTSTDNTTNEAELSSVLSSGIKRDDGPRQGGLQSEHIL